MLSVDKIGWFLVEERIDDLRVLLFPKDQWEADQVFDYHYFLIKKKEVMEIIYTKEIFYKEGWVLDWVSYGTVHFNYDFKEDLFSFLNQPNHRKKKEDIISFFERFFIRLEGVSNGKNHD